MKRLLTLVCAILLPLGVVATSSQAMEPHPVVEAALSMLPEGNPILTRYQALTGSEMAARYPLGVPYFFGGLAADKILRVMQPWQDSVYYKQENFYLYGFDCAGFTAWALREAGGKAHPAISQLLRDSYSYGRYQLPLAGLAWDELPKHLQPGDLFALRHSKGFHIMLYLGTLADFSFTAEEVGEELAPYLGYPLLAHASENPFFYEPYADYIKHNFHITKVVPPDGGVMLSLLGVPREAAPYYAPIPVLPGRRTQSFAHYFLLEGYELTVYYLQAEQSGWFRWQ